MAQLAGSRLVASIEVEEGRTLAEGLVKSLSGGDNLRTRELYKAPFEFMPQMKLWLVANNRPKVNANDDANWRRLMIVPFTHQIPEENRDPNIKRILRDVHVSGPAILAWMVKGCLEWQAEGLMIPTAVRAATQEYRKAMDKAADFLEECCRLDPSALVPSAEFYGAYKTWCSNNGEQPISQTAMREALKARNCTPDRVSIDSKQTRIWRGIELSLSARQLDATDSTFDKTELVSGQKETLSKQASMASRRLEQGESDVSQTCSLCDAEVEHITPDGIAYCERHYPETAEELSDPFAEDPEEDTEAVEL